MSELLEDDLAVVEVMTHTCDLLISLVALACDEDQVACRGQHRSRANSLGTIGNRERAAQLFGAQTSTHLLDDRYGIFATGIIGGEDEAVGTESGFVRHDRTLTAVTVATTADDADDLRPL